MTDHVIDGSPCCPGVRGRERDDYNREWLPIATAPKDATEIRVRMADGTVHERAHWAQDLSGDDQPAFMGWFVPDEDGSGFTGIKDPKFWRPIDASRLVRQLAAMTAERDKERARVAAQSKRIEFMAGEGLALQDRAERAEAAGAEMRDAIDTALRYELNKDHFAIGTVERVLREALARPTPGQSILDELARRRAEVERLRKAIRLVLEWDDLSWEYVTAKTKAAKTALIACRAALAAQPQEDRP